MNHMFNGVGCSGIYGDLSKNKNWVVYVWYIEPTTKVPMKHILVNDLNELDKAIEDLKNECEGENTKYVVVLQDNNTNYIPIKFSGEDLKLAIETDEEYWDRIGEEYLEEVYTKEELECVGM